MEGFRLGPYQLLNELGRGGMGKVFRAEVIGAVPGLEPGCAVALKVIHAHLLETPGFFKRFLREADLGRTIEHENVVRTYDCDALLHEGVQQNYLVMEYVEGQTLRDLLQELERVPEELCRHIGREIAKGLAAIHEAGVIHRDLKPENVLITEDHVVKVMDLGVARLQAEAIRLSQTGAFVGSLEYAAPEQFRSSEGATDGRADLHALGVLLYELSTGRHPYRDEDAAKVIRSILDDTPRKVGELNPQLSAFFEEVVQNLIAKDRDARFPAASDLADVLEAGEESAWWTARAKALRVETKRPLRRIRIPRETALYGRDGDLAKLRDRYERAASGDGQVLLIEGEAGIGKTRLVDEFVAGLRQECEDPNFLFGSYPPGGAATAAGAFSTAYGEHFGRASLEDTLGGYLTATPILIPAFAAILKGETTPTGSEPLTKASLQTVFVHATRGLAAERTTIVLIDDLHFAPGDGRALFTSLATAVPEHRILLIGTMRPGVPEEWTAGITRLDHAEQRSLARLGPKDLTRLLKDAFRSEKLATALGFRIAEKSDGNPFFAFEIIRGLREGQFIAQEADGTWVTTKVIEEIQVPSSVQDLVQARIADLSDEEKNLLDVASCAGFDFDPLLAAEVLGVPEVPALQRLAKIERRHRLVRSAGRRFVFDHHQMQEALYGGLPELLRERYHAAIADALEKRAAADGASRDPAELEGGLCVELCDHALKGGQGERAFRYFPRAREHLVGSYHGDRAVSLSRRILSVPGLVEGAARLEVLLEVNTLLYHAGNTDEQQDVLIEARPLAEAEGALALAALERAQGALYLAWGKWTEARQCTERSLSLARETDDVEAVAAATINLGIALRGMGQAAAAETCGLEGRRLAIAAGNRHHEANAASGLGNTLIRLSRFEEAQEQFERYLVLTQEVGDRGDQAQALSSLGGLALTRGRFREAEDRYEQARDLLRGVGDRVGEAFVLAGYSGVLQGHGRLDEARAMKEECLKLTREIGSRGLEAHALGSLGLVHQALGELATSLECFEQSITLARRTGSRYTEGTNITNMGLTLLALGEPTRARAAFEDGLRICRETQDRRFEATALFGLSLTALERRDLDAAHTLAEQTIEMRREVGVMNGLARSLWHFGELRWRMGRENEAVEALQEVVQIGREHGIPYITALATASLARMRGGDLTAARKTLAEDGDASNRREFRLHLWQAGGERADLEEAKRLLDEHLEKNPARYHDGMRENVGVNREILEAWAEHGGDEE